MSPSRDSLQAILERCGIALARGQYDQLWAYHGLLRGANAELNLTRIHNFENMVHKHYVDSLLILTYVELPSPLVDMGSGPGLPGIPLKIARPELSMILAEPRGARAEFLRQVCRQLGLHDVTVYAGKVGPRFPHRAAGIITRAVGSIPETLERVASVIDAGGRMYFMKGPACGDEVVEASRTHADQFRLVADHAYRIGETTHERRLIVYERLPVGAVAPERSHARAPREVTSETNATFRLCRDLLTGRGIRKHGRALLAGPRPVAEVLARYPDLVEAWVTDSGGVPPPETVPSLTWLRMVDSLFATLDTAGTHAPLLLVRIPEISWWKPQEPWPAGCTLFVPFQDPENVGAVIRSSAAFGVARIVLLREAAHPFHPKAARAAGTALFQVPLLFGPSLSDLDPAASPLIALSADGEEIAASPFPEYFGLVPGLEGPGLPARLRGGPRRRIPIVPAVDSLNAATATAVALYEWRRQKEANPARSPG